MATIFGTRLSRRHRGKLAGALDRIEHGHHVYRAYFKNAFLKQYEKFATFLRNELCSNNLADFGLRKSLDHLDAVRSTPRRARHPPARSVARRNPCRRLEPNSSAMRAGPRASSPGASHPGILRPRRGCGCDE
jgi:hypothetical protein